MFQITHDSGDTDMISFVSRPVLGFGLHPLEANWTGIYGSNDGRKACLHEMMLMSAALAIRLSCSLTKDVSDDHDRQERQRIFEEHQRGSEKNTTKATPPTVCKSSRDKNLTHHVMEDKILGAARLIFRLEQLSRKDLADYVDAHNKAPTQETPPPATLLAACSLYGYDVSYWKEHHGLHFSFLTVVYRLSIVILAFAHAMDPKDLPGLLVNVDISVLSNLNIITQVDQWRGDNQINVVDDTWFEVVARLMTGYAQNADTRTKDGISLVSHRGWTVHLPTYGNIDPGYIGMHHPICAALRGLKS